MHGRSIIYCRPGLECGEFSSVWRNGGGWLELPHRHEPLTLIIANPCCSFGGLEFGGLEFGGLDWSLGVRLVFGSFVRAQQSRSRVCGVYVGVGVGGSGGVTF